ncbi:TipAS antibiotic-recognition domain-containing protein [Alteromonas oceanisediminis]|uniref:TipAS antibiotic-recognition domain-containing protein n=1 Tax=Alteromonas oceanisediminis TaxID=2836180 RepID=UPI001BDB3043|nr:TipAS antibiotic-recognition domain-containing protein [Alteromonas oceanisediminis]MBT0587072.1 TipAS antibiotic-recognition domain-containing protein [Alteromonas oceanisediminis]
MDKRVSIDDCAKFVVFSFWHFFQFASVLITMMMKLLFELEQSVLRNSKGNTMVLIPDKFNSDSSQSSSAIRHEAYTLYGEELIAVEERLSSRSKAEANAVHEQGALIAREIALHENYTPNSPEMMNLMLRQLNWLENYYRVTEDRFRGLADLYISDSRFANYYDSFGSNTAEKLSRAMMYFANHFDWHDRK